ncbi:DUF1330 domain-containing protein [Streptomyces sp. NBC_01497]|uniref:DUF1330 domain-containing protein n=1 Tax=Streptomyces sp. NBC_01497 TaxID=2903885 RepID=UPI002E2FC78D|nr:DUF1330 domain-containing protein [Streptomyces sp. NBC_01497]
MSTYLINHLRIPGGIPNEAGLSYLEQVEETAKPFGGRWLANGEATVVEGTWPGSVVLMEFPDRSAAERWYDSPGYRRIRPLRVNNSISDMVLIDSLPQGYTVRGFAQQIRGAVKEDPSSGTA